MGGPFELAAVFVPQMIDRERAAGAGLRVEARRELDDIGLLFHAGDLHQIQNVFTGSIPGFAAARSARQARRSRR
jgi:hypothetical protein